MSEAKTALRAAQVAARDGLTPEQRAAATAAIVARVRSLPAWQRAQCVLSYMAFGSELDLGVLHRELLLQGRLLVAPRVPAQGRALELRQVADLAQDLAPSRWGIPEPQPERCPLVDPAQIDLVLVPGLAFDRWGNRLGYGAGFYDRLFQRLSPSALRVACLQDALMVDRVPAEAHDVPVDLLVTESMALVCQREAQA
jgi:5,10-methenyltetrahydrofolate synthetase